MYQEREFLKRIGKDVTETFATEMMTVRSTRTEVSPTSSSTRSDRINCQAASFVETLLGSKYRPHLRADNFATECLSHAPISRTSSV